MYCNNCGKEIKNNIKFCPYCGSEVEEESFDKNDLNTKNQVLENGEKIEHKVVVDTSKYEKKKCNTKIKKIFIAIIGTLFIGVLVILILVVLNKDVIYQKKAESYMEDGAYDEAIDYYYESLEANKNSIDAYIGLVDAYIFENEFDHAIEVLNNIPEDINDERIDERILITSDNKTYLSDSTGTCRYVLDDNTKWIYDENERLLKVYKKEGANDTLIFKIEYDANGNEIALRNYNGEENLLKEHIFSFKNGNVTEDKLLYADGTCMWWHKFNYDDNGNKILEFDYDQNGEEIGIKEMKYDSYGNEIEGTYHDDKGCLESWYEHEYDSKGNIISSIYHQSGTDKTYFDYEYDNYGNRVKTYKYKKQNNPKLFCESEYDANGNETKTIMYDSYGEVEFTSESEYVYFDDYNIKTKTTYLDGEFAKEYNYEYGIDDMYIYDMEQVYKNNQYKK